MNMYHLAQKDIITSGTPVLLDSKKKVTYRISTVENILILADRQYDGSRFQLAL